MDAAIWYCDGSMLNGRWEPLRFTGFGIAVVSDTGDLLAYGLGWPPSWCDTAAAAEAWALQVVLTLCPFPPQTRTDCMALLTTAKFGTASATHHSKPLARVWKLIAETLDVDISALLQGDKLAWMPAHKSLTAVGEVKLSNGCRLTNVDWRANRLVDKLAKMAASELQCPKSTAELLASAEAASAHAACLLGMVTFAANNCVEVVINEDGTTSSKVVRDSQDKPKFERTSSAPPTVARSTAAPPSALQAAGVRAWRPPSARTAAMRQHSDEARELLTRRVQDIGAALRERTTEASGSQRLSELRARVLARCLH